MSKSMAEMIEKSASVPRARIGLITHYMPPHPGGIEIAAEAIFNSYVTSGHEVRWIASRVPKNLPAHDDRFVRVNCWNGLERWFGVPWPVWGPKAIPDIARLVRWADVLHIHDCLYMSSALAVLFARRRGKPVLLSQHIGFVSYRSRLLKAIEYLAYHTLGRSVLLACSHLVLCTPAAEQFVMTWLGERLTRVSMIPNGIDTTRFRPPDTQQRLSARRRFGLPDRGTVVLFTGRLVEKKGIDIFLEVARRTPKFQFLIVGDGPRRPSPAANLVWVPFVSADRMEAPYQAADVFLLPSYGEGFPVSVLEALATGLPVIVSKDELFAQKLERESACLPSERTPEAICNSLHRLIAEPELSASLSTRSRELAVREWSLEKMASRYIESVRALLPAA